MRLLASFFLLAFTTVVTVGCGSSDDFVATNGFTPASNTGDLVFRTFTLASAQTIEVPAATTDLDFEFFDAANNSVFTYTQGFAPEVIVKNVPTSAKRVVITARGPNGPLATIEANVAVTPGGQTVVDLSGATITLLGQLIVEPETLQFAPGGLIGLIESLNITAIGNQLNSIALFRAYYVPPGGTERIEVTSRVGVRFENASPSGFNTDGFAYLNILGDGIAVTFNPLNGDQLPWGATADMVVVYIADGQVYTDKVGLVLDNPVFTGIEVQDLSLPATGVTNFPILSFAKYSNGLKLPIIYDADNNGGTALFPGSLSSIDTFKLEVQTAASGLVLNPEGLLSTTGGGDGTTGVFSVTRTGGEVANFNVNLITGAVTEVALNVVDTDVNPTSSYSVVATYQDGTTQDLTPWWFELEIEPGTPPGFVSPLGLVDTLSQTSSGRLLGLGNGLVTFRLADGTTADVTTFLNGPLGLGLPGTDTLATNNSVELNVLSTVPLGSLLASLPFPIPGP